MAMLIYFMHSSCVLNPLALFSPTTPSNHSFFSICESVKLEKKIILNYNLASRVYQRTQDREKAYEIRKINIISAGFK